jgi:hypothetical protein
MQPAELFLDEFIRFGEIKRSDVLGLNIFWWWDCITLHRNASHISGVDPKELEMAKQMVGLVYVHLA